MRSLADYDLFEHVTLIQKDEQTQCTLAEAVRRVVESDDAISRLAFVILRSGLPIRHYEDVQEIYRREDFPRC